MADIGAAIIERLEGHAPFWTPLGGRVDWTVSQQSTPFPRAVLTIITAQRDDHFDGPDLRFTRLQLDVYSDTSAAEAAAIAEEGINALQPEATVGGVRFNRAVEVDGPTDGGDQTDTLYAFRARTDFALLHADEGV